MQITSRTNRGYWATVAVGVTIGIVYLIGFAAGGKPLTSSASSAGWPTWPPSSSSGPAARP
jgi:hypothetical protein